MLLWTGYTLHTPMCCYGWVGCKKKIYCNIYTCTFCIVDLHEGVSKRFPFVVKDNCHEEDVQNHHSLLD